VVVFFQKTGELEISKLEIFALSVITFLNWLEVNLHFSSFMFVNVRNRALMYLK